MFSKNKMNKSTENYLVKLQEAFTKSNAILIGAGSGLSTAAGFTYSGERFKQYFFDFAQKYPIRDIYSGGFYPFESLEEYWAWWSRHIWINRYMDPTNLVYEHLYSLVKDKEYFILTTNVDHCFQKTGFQKNKLFYTQGDYGLFQCSLPCHDETYDNEAIIRKMIESQGFTIDSQNNLILEKKDSLRMRISTDLIPYCPKCGKPMTVNLRSDSTFVEDAGWNAAQKRYMNFILKHQYGNILYLELGVGANTPAIIKYPFWRMTFQNKNATYACINYGEAMAPIEIKKQSICINASIDQVITELDVQTTSH